MRAVVQRVGEARVVVDDEVVGEIGDGGLLVLAGAAPSDTPADATALAAKLVGLRVFADADGRMNLAVGDVGGSVLVVSQFTLLADVRKGRRPAFTAAAPPDVAEPLIDALAADIRSLGIPCQTGRFGARMDVHLVNRGPVTLVIDVANGKVL